MESLMLRSAVVSHGQQCAAIAPERIPHNVMRQAVCGPHGRGSWRSLAACTSTVRSAGPQSHQARTCVSFGFNPQPKVSGTSL